MQKISKLFLTLGRFAIAILLFAYLATSGAIDWAALNNLLVSWRFTLVAFVTLLACFGLTSWRLCILMKSFGFHVSLPASLRLTFIGNFFNVCLPGATGGDVVRIYYAMQGNEGRRTEVATIIMMDRAIGMVALFLVPVLMTPLLFYGTDSLGILQPFLWLTAGCLGSLLLFLFFIALVRTRLEAILHSLAQSSTLGRYVGTVVSLTSSYWDHRGPITFGILLSIVNHILNVTVIGLLAYGLTLKDISWQVLSLIPFGFLANSLPITPGGLGVGEMAFEHLFNLGGLAGGAEALLGWRILMVMSGLIGLAIYLQRRNQCVFQMTQASNKAVRTYGIPQEPMSTN